MAHFKCVCIKKKYSSPLFVSALITKPLNKSVFVGRKQILLLLTSAMTTTKKQPNYKTTTQFRFFL